MDFIPDCLNTGFKHGELDDLQKKQLKIHIAQVKEVMNMNRDFEREFEPYLCFLRYLNSGNFENKNAYQLCLEKAIELLK